jgi:hypothetical protein
MSDFERRLHAMQRRDSGDQAHAGSSTSTKVAVPPADLGWQAAERLIHLTDVGPGTSIKLIVEGRDDHSRLEVHWDETGVASVQQY